MARSPVSSSAKFEVNIGYTSFSQNPKESTWLTENLSRSLRQGNLGVFLVRCGKEVSARALGPLIRPVISPDF